MEQMATANVSKTTESPRLFLLLLLLLVFTYKKRPQPKSSRAIRHY